MSQEGRDEKGRFTEKNIWSVMRKNVGQPKKIPTPEELAYKALEYFDWCSEVDKGKFAFAELRLYVGMNRTDWHNYKHNYPEYFNTICHIEEMLEASWEKKLTWAGSTQGAIFWLKNKAGWKDEQHNTNTNTTFNADFGQIVQPTSESGQDTPGDK
jgi:hypothetical protein